MFQMGVPGDPPCAESLGNEHDLGKHQASAEFFFGLGSINLHQQPASLTTNCLILSSHFYVLSDPLETHEALALRSALCRYIAALQEALECHTSYTPGRFLMVWPGFLTHITVSEKNVTARKTLFKLKRQDDEFLKKRNV